MVMALVVVLSVGAPLCLVVVILGCLNCFIKRKPGFTPFSNPNFAEEGTAGRNNDAFAVDMEPTSSPSDESHVTIESLPDVTPKVVPLPPLRPKILAIDKDSQSANISYFSSHRPFPRENLTYLNPVGVGWFGQVILSEALRISTGSMRSRVVVKILKDDASSIEEKQFIDEILPFRHLDHPNVLTLLGQCTESRPYLYIVEYAPNGDLKTFLQSHKQSMDTLLKKNKLLHFCLDIAAGVACIHRHNFVHCDLSSRNCLVMADYKVKIGDYGIADQSFKEDYFQSNNALLPIRWMAPECLTMNEGGNWWSSQNFSKASDIWSFGVLLWEVFSMAEQPYDMLTDEAVLQGVVIDKVVSLADIPLRIPFHDRLSVLMNECWRDPAERINIEAAHQILDEMSKEKVERVTDELDFDQKWNHLIPNTQSRSQSLASEDGSAIALAGSFSSETLNNFDDKPTSSTASVEEREAQKRDSPSDNVASATEVSSQITANDQIDLTPREEPDQTLFTKDEMEVNSIMPDAATPSKTPPQQMTTSTPLANKTVQDKTSSFLTAPNTPNSPYVTAEEGFTMDNTNFDSLHSAQNFGSLNSSEGNKRVQETEIEAEYVKDDSNKKEEGLTQSSLTFDDFASFNSDNNASQENMENLVGAEIESGETQEHDASFDIIVPSMLGTDQNLVETPSQQITSSPSSQNASFDFDFTQNNNQSVSSPTNHTCPSIAKDKNDALANSNHEPESDNSRSEVDKSIPHESIANLSFGSDLLQISTSNPFTSTSSNPFSSPAETNSLSSHDAAMFMDKSDIDASSSLNSTSLLGGWDASFPDSLDPAKDAGQNTQQQSGNIFLNDAEGPKEESSPLTSSDFSFVEASSAVSDAGIVDFPTSTIPTQTNNQTTTESSLLSGFEVPVSSDVTTDTVSPLSSDDLFGSAISSSATTTSQSSPFFSDNTSKTTTIPDPPGSLSSDPFDFSAFETKDSTPKVADIETQQKSLADNSNIFPSGFDDLGRFNNDQEQKMTVPTSLSSSNFPGFDLLSGDGTTTSPTAAVSNTESAGLMLGGDLLPSMPSTGDNQVGTSTTVYKYDDDSNPFPRHSEEEESGVIINSYHSLSESLSIPLPTAIAISSSDSCYTSGLVTDSGNVEDISSSEEISSQAFATTDTTSDCAQVADYNHKDNHSDSTEAEESSSSNCDLGKGDLESDVKSSSNPEDSYSSDETSSTSGSEREYICVNPFDTGQPPTSFNSDHDNKENLDPDYANKDLSFDDLNEQDLKIVSEIYLSKGVKSPRVFEVPALETIPEHQPLHCISEDTILTPSETSSVGPRDDELFGSDSYEWDDFYGDSLIGKDVTGPEMEDEEIRHSPQNNISNWSLDFEADSNHYSSNASSSVLSTTTLNRSDSVCSTGKDNDTSISTISDHKVHSLSDSELFMSKNSTLGATARPSLVASTLAKHRNRSMQFSSPLKNSSRNKGNNFYSLMEDFDDFQLDSSQEEISSPVYLSDDDEFALVDVDMKSHPPSYNFPQSVVSSSSFPFNSFPPPVIPEPATILNSSSHTNTHALSPKKSTPVLAIDKDAIKDPKVFSTPSINSNDSTTPSSSMDLLGLGFDPVTPVPNGSSSDVSAVEQNSLALDGFSSPGNSQRMAGGGTVEASGDPFDSLI